MSGDLQGNKILGAVLAAGLVIMVVKIGSGYIYEQKPPAKPGYFIDVPVTEASGGEAAPVDTPPDWGTVLPAADVAAGEKVFVKCEACHNNAQGGPNMTGPNLWGVVGRPTASHPGFDYSDGMKAHAKESPNWSYDQIYMFLGGPQKWVKGTKMTFIGVKKPEDRINLIAYLRTQGSSGYPIPAPKPAGAATSAAATPAGTPATASAPAASAAVPADAKAAAK
jgi:cytochrome c